jgi:SNF2 family DNA or RNA helicase
VSIERIERIAQTLVELFDANGLGAQQALGLPRSQLGRVAQLVADAEADDAGARDRAGRRDRFVLQSDDSALLARIREVREFTRTERVVAPSEFRTTLRSYQEEGLAWLQFLRRHGTGGILADDMGLGKTVQTLAHLALEREQGRLRKPCLIVTPVSVIGHWERELRTLVPQLKVLTLHGARRKESFAKLAGADIAITGYPLLQIDSEALLAQEFYILILDEAQTIKNPRAKVSQAARALRAEHRLCLTGTPIENHLGELWSLFEFLQPGMLGDEQQFQRHYRTPIERGGNLKRFQALTLRVAPFILRRTKDAVAKELPPKTQIVESIVMEQSQRDFYDGIRLAMHRRVREVIEQQGLARSHITVLDALLKLRQACCDPRLVRLDGDSAGVPSAKMEWLTTMLPELIEGGRRILLFSQFTSMLALIEASLRELGIPYDVLTGETRNRTALVDRFQARAVPLLLISLKAGGTGLNLTAADTVIHYDPWWNPAAEAQATDRAHRIGQDKPVFVYKLIAQGTVEEAIMRLQADKHALASQLYEQHGALPAQLTSADIENLFAS